MNDINNAEYGRSHAWKMGNTYQSPNPHDRFTIFTCTSCGAYFEHFYHQIPIIGEAMKKCGIENQCPGEKNE